MTTDQEGHEATPNSMTTKRVSAASLPDGETTAPKAQAGEGPVLGGLPDASRENMVVSK